MFFQLKTEGLADAVLTWTSSPSRRRSNTPSFSFRAANLLLVVASAKAQEPDEKQVDHYTVKSRKRGSCSFAKEISQVKTTPFRQNTNPSADQQNYYQKLSAPRTVIDCKYVCRGALPHRKLAMMQNNATYGNVKG